MACIIFLVNESEEKKGDIKIGDGNIISGVVGGSSSNRNNTTNIHLHVEKTGNLLLYLYPYFYHYILYVQLCLFIFPTCS